jgi:hypothetical protein
MDVGIPCPSRLKSRWVPLGISGTWKAGEYTSLSTGPAPSDDSSDGFEPLGDAGVAEDAAEGEAVDGSAAGETDADEDVLVTERDGWA